MIIKRIMSKEEKEKIESKKRKTIVIVMTIIMVLSSLGYVFMSQNRERTGKTKMNYNGIDFNLREDGWHFQIEGLDFVTIYSPKDTENISAAIFLNAWDYYGKPLYFSRDSPQEGIIEIEKNLNRIASRMQYACLDENCSEFAVKNCSSDNIIVIKESEKNETFISQEDNCIVINALPSEIVRASDKFLYKILGLN
ncbi:MAG: hypothetical protein QW622_02580 [Candidatus Pacearchaeota archaeon]